jgi:hypothetical protein
VIHPLRLWRYHTPLQGRGNYPAVLAFSDHVAKELDKICATRFLHPIAPSSVIFFTPINAVIKNSDKNRARTIGNVVIDH